MANPPGCDASSRDDVPCTRVTAARAAMTAAAPAPYYTPMSTLGWIHTATALAALVTGAGVLLRSKGTRRRRQLGWTYVASMVLLNATALAIYRLTGSFGPFHVAALLSLATVVAGAVPAVRRRPAGTWVEYHYWWMTYSYLGLLAATAAEVATRVPGINFWWSVIAASAAVFALGAPIIRRRARSTLAPFLPSSG
jgi:uncharacterized membrane protein